nr:hypothetical protein [uncultured Agathobaculum sp.]
MTKPTGILAMDPEHYREIDGVVFDLDSFAKHCQPAQTAPPSEQKRPVPESIKGVPPHRADNGDAAGQTSSTHPSQPAAETQPIPTKAQPPEIVGVFPADPYPDGWYPAENDQPPVPIMGGALPPVGITEDGVHTVTAVRTVLLRTGSGSGSGSYATSYTTSYRMSYRTSGSGSYVFGSCTYAARGYGLELI